MSGRASSVSTKATISLTRMRVESKSVNHRATRE